MAKHYHVHFTEQWPAMKMTYTNYIGSGLHDAKWVGFSKTSPN